MCNCGMGKKNWKKAATQRKSKICDENIKDNMVNYEKQCKNSRKTVNGMLPKLDGELLYKIRCSVLHAMSSNIDFKNIGLSDDANRHTKNFLYFIIFLNEIKIVCFSVPSSDPVGQAGYSADLI